MKGDTATDPRAAALGGLLDSHVGHFRDLADAADFGAYCATKPSREDEEILTEPVLTEILQLVLGFPVDEYYAQYGRGGLKPDLTPMDTIAHSFVLDAKSSLQDLGRHETQIRSYIDQRQLDFGVLFNLRELRVYRRGKSGHDQKLSFSLLPVWKYARGESMQSPDLTSFLAFLEQFSHRELTTEDRIDRIRSAERWATRDPAGALEIDVEYLVENLRRLARLLTADAEAQETDLTPALRLAPGREADLLHELEVLALDLEPGVSFEALPGDLASYMAASGDLPARVWRQYLLRVSQLALSRILLYRSWEDADFVQSYLYDGGFGQVYDRLESDLRELLLEAFAHGGMKYHWLFGTDNNYDWYKPRDDALVEVLYTLTQFPLGRLDADVLGGLYESYVDEIDRDRLGQFYTPRAVVRFMLGRAGLEGPEGVFKVEGDSRKPLSIMDFATGSGGFLVEAARRIIDEVGVDEGDVQGLNEALEAIVTGLHGSEISPFPYYLTEINLLLQVSRVLGALRSEGQPTPNFALSVVHADTLTTRAGGASSIEGFDSASRADDAELAGEEGYGLVPLDAEKRQAFARMRETEAFDLVVGNPPYVFESNNRILFERLRGIAAWRDDYRGKSDLLYYFLALAAEKVREGGRISVITPAAWMNAGAASWLREKLAGVLRLDELFLFGSYRLFAPEHEARGRRFAPPPPTVESAILVATKAPAPTSHRMRIVALEDERRAAETLGRFEGDSSPDRELLLIEMARRFDGRQGRKGGIHVHDLKQAGLDHELPWPIKHAPKDVASRVVKHLERGLKAGELERLDKRWDIPQGIQTGADGYSRRIQKRLKNEFPDAKATLDARDAQTGTPIMELPAGAEAAEPWKARPDLLARSIEPTAILYGAMDEAESTSLVWIARDDDVPAAIQEALEPWRPVLANRAEIARNSSRRWFETAWPRNKEQLRKPKVIALYRTDRGRFALDETGDWQPSIKTTLVIAKSEGESVAYLCGLLNSELLDLWYGVRGKIPRDVWRNYEPKPMARIPYRPAQSSGGSDSSIDDLRTALAGDDPGAILAAADALGPHPLDDAVAAMGVELLVRAIAANRRDLLPLRRLAPALTRIVKNPWRIGPVQIDESAAITEMPDSALRSVRLDQALDVSVDSDGALGRNELEAGELRFYRSSKRTALVSGAPARLALLSILIGSDRRLLEADLLAVKLPKDLGAFEGWLVKRHAEIVQRLDLGRAMVEAIERLVCRLYGLPRSLEDEVVLSAQGRAAEAG